MSLRQPAQHTKVLTSKVSLVGSVMPFPTKAGLIALSAADSATIRACQRAAFPHLQVDKRGHWPSHIRIPFTFLSVQAERHRLAAVQYTGDEAWSMRFGLTTACKHKQRTTSPLALPAARHVGLRLMFCFQWSFWRLLLSELFDPWEGTDIKHQLDISVVLWCLLVPLTAVTLLTFKSMGAN